MPIETHEDICPVCAEKLREFRNLATESLRHVVFKNVLEREKAIESVARTFARMFRETIEGAFKKAGID